MQRLILHLFRRDCQKQLFLQETEAEMKLFQERVVE